MNTLKLLLISTIIFSVSCSKGFNFGSGVNHKSNNEADDTNNSAKTKKVLYPKTTIDDDFALFPEVKQIIKKNDCVQSKTCITQIIEAGLAPLKSEQILVFEQVGVPWSSFLRYNDRVSGFYTINDFGNYKRYVPKATVSSPLLEAMDYLNRKDFPISKLIPSLGRFLYSHSQIEILNDLPGRIEAHSRIVFELMVDKNPDVNFIFADNPDLSINELCGTLNSDNSYIMQKIQRKFDAAMVELSDLIRINKIKYINASFVSTPEIESQNMYQVCHSSDYNVAKQIFEMKTKFLKKLIVRNPEILLVQAVPNDNYNDYDCIFDRRWIRVGYTTIPNSSISANGLPLDDEYLPSNMRAVRSCITLAINSGTTDKTDFDSVLPKYFDENSAYFNHGGLYAYPIDSMATSWATPLALSFIRANSKNKDLNFIYTSVIDRIFDPLKNKQFIESK